MTKGLKNGAKDKSARKVLKVCEKGHRYDKSSDCPVCPVCEREKQPNGFLAALAAPARRALENAGINTLEKLTTYAPEELLALHGFGKSSLPKLEKELSNAGLTFKKS